MTGPSRRDPHQQYQSDQAYSQAIPLQPPRGPAGPGPVPGAMPPPPPPPPRGSNSGRNLVVALVAIAAVVAVTAAVVVAALLSNSSGDDTGLTTAPPTPDPAAAQFRVNDCLYDVPEAPKVGNCADGGSPYQVTQVMPLGQECPSNQTSFATGRWYCLRPNLNINYCYSAPAPGTWITAARECGAPGTMTVVSVVAGLKDSARCTGDWDQSYFFDNPVYTICALTYT